MNLNVVVSKLIHQPELSFPNVSVGNLEIWVKDSRLKYTGMTLVLNLMITLFR